MKKTLSEINHLKTLLENLNPIKVGQHEYHKDSDVIYYVNEYNKPFFFYYTKWNEGFVHQDIYNELYLNVFNYNAVKTSETIGGWIKSLYGLEIEIYDYEEGNREEPFDWDKIIKVEEDKEYQDYLRLKEKFEK